MSRTASEVKVPNSVKGTQTNGTMVVSGILVCGYIVNGTVVRSNETTSLISRVTIQGILANGLLVDPTLIRGSLVAGTLINAEVVGGNFTCPDSHFWCSNNDDSFCVPVFVRCNHVYDCPGGEDEAACDRYLCPGFYRCRGSSVCVHKRHMCDGLIHCPQMDDELLCDLTCPSGCTCFGLAFFCSRVISIAAYHQLRFLDASDSGMSVPTLENNTMLVYVSLVRCNVADWPPITLPNLRTLDLTHNNVMKITDQLLQHLPKLKHLTLAQNPLTSAFLSELFNSSQQQPSFRSVRTLDVGGTFLPELNLTLLKVFPDLRAINLTGCGLDRVLGGGLRFLTKLRLLDVRGCALTFFPRDLFRDLAQLTTVYADNYKLCCRAMLPVDFYIEDCEAPSNEISSCEDLLRSNVFRLFLCFSAVLSCVGNLASFLFRTKKSSKSFDILVSNLCISDFLMGVYLAIIGVADRLYMGAYTWSDVTWRHSASCKVAGFLSLLSSEVSAFVICLITLDRFLVLRFPFSQLRFSIATAYWASASVWMLCFVIAAVPLLPPTSHWQFYSQTGICVPLPITRGDFKGHVYLFGVVIALNFALFLFIALGQLLIYMSVQTHKMPTVHETVSSHVFSRDQALARRLITVAASDFLCWFPIGLLGMITANGYRVPGEANMVLAIFVLPVNSVINPFLYTLNTMLERNRLAREKRIRQSLLSQLKGQQATSGS